MSEIGVKELADILQQDSEWMNQHYNELIEKYPGQMVAIERGKIVAVGERAVEDYCTVYKAEQDVNPLVLNVPHPDEIMPFLT